MLPVVRKRIIERILEYAMGSFAPSLFTIFSDSATAEVRFLLSSKPAIATNIKNDNFTIVFHFVEHAVWPELNCEHEWTAIAFRNYKYGKFRLWYCNNCAAIGPRKVITQNEMLNRANKFNLPLPLGLLKDWELLKDGPFVAKQ